MEIFFFLPVHPLWASCYVTWVFLLKMRMQPEENKPLKVFISQGSSPVPRYPQGISRTIWSKSAYLCTSAGAGKWKKLTLSCVIWWEVSSRSMTESQRMSVDSTVLKLHLVVWWKRMLHAACCITRHPNKWMIQMWCENENQSFSCNGE